MIDAARGERPGRRALVAGGGGRQAVRQAEAGPANEAIGCDLVRVDCMQAVVYSALHSCTYAEPVNPAIRGCPAGPSSSSWHLLCCPCTTIIVMTSSPISSGGWCRPSSCRGPRLVRLAGRSRLRRLHNQADGTRQEEHQDNSISGLLLLLLLLRTATLLLDSAQLSTHPPAWTRARSTPEMRRTRHCPTRPRHGGGGGAASGWWRPASPWPTAAREAEGGRWKQRGGGRRGVVM